MCLVKLNQIAKSYQVQKLDFRASLLNFLGLKKIDLKLVKALNNISFSLEKGSVLGVIGRNGAGKSTLLKILAKILKPSSGELILANSIQALLNPGAGLHFELTGNENLIFQAILLGLSKNEALNKLKTMQNITGLNQDSLNQQLKYYSDGMKLRIAFAPAIIQEADLWVIDEIMGVGDGAFLPFSLDLLMNKVKLGSTMVMTTHDLGLIEKVATHILWLEKGEIRAFSQDKNLIYQYAEFINLELQKQYQNIKMD